MISSAILQREPLDLVSNSAAIGTTACPECGRPAEVAYRFVLPSTDGPIEHVRLRCDAGRHHLTHIVEGR